MVTNRGVERPAATIPVVGVASFPELSFCVPRITSAPLVATTPYSRPCGTRRAS